MPRLLHHALDCNQVDGPDSALGDVPRHRRHSRLRASRSCVLRPGLTLPGVIVVLIVTGRGVAISVPAINTAREAARRSTCKHHLEQIGLGINNYHTAYDMFPMHRTDPTNEFNDDCCSKAMEPEKYPQASSLSLHQLSYFVG